MSSPTESNSAVDRVLGRIRELIADDGLGLGDPLPPENELARRFGASRNTVREAISTLKAYGVVEPRKRVGPVLVDNRHSAVSTLFSFSQEISPEAFKDIQGFRRLVECGIAEEVTGLRTEADLERLRRLNREMQDAPSIVMAAEKDYLFHLRIVQIIGNSTTYDVYKFLEPVIRRLLESGKSQRRARVDIGGEHEGVIAAIESRDKLAYQYRMNQHLHSGLKFIV